MHFGYCDLTMFIIESSIRTMEVLMQLNYVFKIAKPLLTIDSLASTLWLSLFVIIDFTSTCLADVFNHIFGLFTFQMT